MSTSDPKTLTISQGGQRVQQEEVHGGSKTIWRKKNEAWVAGKRMVWEDVRGCDVGDCEKKGKGEEQRLLLGNQKKKRRAQVPRWGVKIKWYPQSNDNCSCWGKHLKAPD